MLCNSLATANAGWINTPNATSTNNRVRRKQEGRRERSIYSA